MWEVETTDEFDSWFDIQDEVTQESILAGMVALQKEGPMLGRPLVDTINGSKVANLKELRVQARGRPYRAFFAFDVRRSAIVLCAGDKRGQKRFYRDMVKKAEELFEEHCRRIENG